MSFFVFDSRTDRTYLLQFPERQGACGETGMAKSPVARKPAVKKPVAGAKKGAGHKKPVSAKRGYSAKKATMGRRLHGRRLQP